MKKKRINWDDVKWTDFEAAVAADDTNPDVLKMREEQGVLVFKNSIYQIEVRGVIAPPPFGKVIWLSFKTLDKQPRHDWREMQRIKNELVGEEIEAVEIFPAESRLVDTSNQYHLWCFPELAFPGKRLPFGYRERLIAEGSTPGIADTGKGARQRDFRPEFRPIDVLGHYDLKGLSLATKEAVGGRCPVDWSPLVSRGKPVDATYEDQKVTMQQLECLKKKHVLFLAHDVEVVRAEELTKPGTKSVSIATDSRDLIAIMRDVSRAVGFRWAIVGHELIIYQETDR